MKKLAIIFMAVCTLCGSFSCSDMLDVDSERQVFDPELNHKTDSLFYAVGILQAMQELADQYVFQGEMRGDLVKTNKEYTDTMLTQLATFTATPANRYDSIYRYYRVINNCNYYIAHRDTALYTGAMNMVKDEYIAVKAIRLWAYLQLVRNYREVPYFTEPLTKISEIVNFPASRTVTLATLATSDMVQDLEQDIQRYPSFATPNYGNLNVSVGTPGSKNTAKTVSSRLLMIPANVVLGDLYLESGDYDKAVSHYVNYFTKQAPAVATNFYSIYATSRRGNAMGISTTALPSNWSLNDNLNVSGTYDWSSIFTTVNSTNDIITYIPMAVNRTQGAITNVPKAFGYNYYATAAELAASEDGAYIDQIQVMPSDAYMALSDSTDYYYFVIGTGSNARKTVAQAKLGDQRMRSIVRMGEGEDSTKMWVRKYENGNIILYRTSTVLLHLAEALNRLDMPDAAFAILKDGLGQQLLGTNADYVTEATRQKLQTTYPLLAQVNLERFGATAYFGIHMHGAGMTRDFNGTDSIHTPYRLDTIVGMKMKELARNFPEITVGTTRQDTINAIEDLLCDEYALECAFEGTRYFDLMRMARHKNADRLYAVPNFGSLWLARKLAYKKPAVDLTVEDNWYLKY